MKKHILLILSLLLFSVSGCQQHQADEHKTEQNNFKSIIRLWPEHHLDTTLTNNLTEAFKKYPSACDEVWFCITYTHFDLKKHRQEAEYMRNAAEKIRSLGIETSIQAVTIGHPGIPGDFHMEPLKWNTMAGYNGATDPLQSCPRDTAFLQRISEICALYAEAVAPSTFLLDDDLRLVAHSPAPFICFCEHCLNLFNQKHQTAYTRESLTEALIGNSRNGLLRQQWIAFSQEGLAGVARAISHQVHKVSPHTQMGLQHTGFHRELVEGWDWNKIFQAMKDETGIEPASRPGHGFYNDHEPRGMIGKGYDIARQIRRLKEGITDISPEIEGYLHKSTGKSPLGICSETLFYLALGGTQMSYAIICSAQESMDWYASHYFKALHNHNRTFKEFAAFNQGSESTGIDAYISPNHVCRNIRPGEAPFAWTKTGANDIINQLATLGIPFAPESRLTTATLMDAEAISGTPDEEMLNLLKTRNLLLDQHAWNTLTVRGLDLQLTPLETTSPLQNVQCFNGKSGKRLAVIPTYTTDINTRQRLNLLSILDWLSFGQMPVFAQHADQMTIVPRIDTAGKLRSVTLLNCSISKEEDIVLRLRNCPNGEHTKVTWKTADNKDLKLPTSWKDGEMIVTIPLLMGWHAGWLAIE